MDGKMKKFVVEVEEPKNGQIVSTGGVRDNGRMVAQFKNPVLYEEPDPTPAPITRSADIIPGTGISTYTMKDRIRDEMQVFIIDVGRDLVDMLWYDLGKPLLKAGLNQVADRLRSSPKKSPQINTLDTCADKDIKIIDVGTEELAPVDCLGKIIQFPKRHVG